MPFIQREKEDMFLKTFLDKSTFLEVAANLTELWVVFFLKEKLN